MTLKIDKKDKAYYNLRKRDGFKKAREIIGFWNQSLRIRAVPTKHFSSLWRLQDEFP